MTGRGETLSYLFSALYKKLNHPRMGGYGGGMGGMGGMGGRGDRNFSEDFFGGFQGGPGPNMRGMGGRGGVFNVHMRGLPFR